MAVGLSFTLMLMLILIFMLMLMSFVPHDHCVPYTRVHLFDFSFLYLLNRMLFKNPLFF